MTNKEAIRILEGLHEQCCQADSIFCTLDSEARCISLDMAISALEQSEKKVGKWLMVTDGNAIRYQCNLCEKMYPNAHGYNFCPNCGMEMEVEQDDTKTISN